MEVIYSKPGDAESIVSTANQLIKAIIGRFNLSIVQPEQVKIDCDQLGALYKKAISESVSINLEPLYPLLQKRSGPVAEHLFVLLSTVAMDQSNVQPLVEAMISARDKSIAIRALQVALLLAESGSLKVNQSFIQFIATRVEADTSTYGEAETVRIVSQIVKHFKPGSRFHQKDPILALYLEDNNLELRCLAARILDLESSAVSHNLMESVLGVEMAEFFAPYFDFTNTRHLDLLSLEPGAMESLRNDFILANSKVIVFR